MSTTTNTTNTISPIKFTTIEEGNIADFQGINVGDKVIIGDADVLREICNTLGGEASPERLSFAGKVVTIQECYGRKGTIDEYFLIEEDDKQYSWFQDMFVGRAKQ